MSTLSVVGDATNVIEQPPPLRVWLIDALCYTPWYTAELSRALRNTGVDLKLICTPHLKEPAFFSEQGIAAAPECTQISKWFRKAPPPIRRVARNADVWRTMQQLIGELKAGKQAKPDIIHLQQTPLLNRNIDLDFKLLEAANKADVAVLHTVHNVLPHDSGDHLRNVYGRLYNDVDHLICHDMAAAHRLSEEFSVPPKKISVIGHGPLFAPAHAPTEQEIRNARRQLKLPEDASIVLWQGIHAPYKGVDVLLEAWKLALAQGLQNVTPAPLLLIAGSGPKDFETTFRLAAQQIGPTVRADLRYIETSELPLYYTAADILTYPYRSITTSGALLTGLSYAKPIIASRLPAFEGHLEDGENALLVEPDNAEQLGTAILSLLKSHAATNRGSAESRANCYSQMKSAALRNTSRYISWGQIGSNTVAVYQRCVA
jgi:glycosyltransferase involved in cell wall biosynthesis